MATRSSLELMLDKLKQLEEQPVAIPPALPFRPVSRARLPRPRRPLQLDFDGRIETSIRKFERKRNMQDPEMLPRPPSSLLLQGVEERSDCPAILHHHRFSSAGIRGNLDRRRPNQIKLQVDLQKRVLKTEAKLRGKREENMALKIKLLEIEKKWQQYEERMKSMEKEWQDELTYIQECLVAGNKNPAPHTITLTTGIPNGRILDIPINSIYDGDRVDEREVVECEEREAGEERVCLKLRPHEELKLRFKAWKKEYKNKLRDAQSTFRKLGINAETAKSHKNWWGRLSH